MPLERLTMFSDAIVQSIFEVIWQNLTGCHYGFRQEHPGVMVLKDIGTTY